MVATAAEHENHESGVRLRDARNWMLCPCILAGIIAVSGYWLITASGGRAPSTLDMSSVYSIGYHIWVSSWGTVVFAFSIVDRSPLQVRYAVMGRPEIPEVSCDLVSVGLWSTFTYWTNTVSLVYFYLALAMGFLQRAHGQAPESMTQAAEMLWAIIFPSSFLVNVVISFVVIPALKEKGEYEGIGTLLSWRIQCLHNGFVLATALEAAIVSPRMQFNDCPVLLLYGSIYIVFAWFLFRRVLIYHYFFLDPRFEYAPHSLVGLACFLAALYCMCFYAMELASDHLVVRGLILAVAAATCKVYDADAVQPGSKDK